MRGIRIVRQPRADPRQFIRRNGRAHAAAANQHSAVRVSIKHRDAHGFGVIRIIYRVGAVRAEIGHRVAKPFKKWNQFLLEWITRMIRADGHPHPEFSTSCAPLAHLQE